jgi:citrate lyase subunit beta/citryl-CoA lyase
MTSTDTSAVTPRRSVIYLPASNARAIDKARTLPCDGVILDLEDSVSPDAKDLARSQLAEALKTGGFGRREVIVRVNGLDTPWGEADLELVSAIAPDAVLVPKIGDAGDIARYEARLSAAPERVQMWAMIETCRSLFHLDGIGAAARTSRLSCLVLGTNDLAKEMGAEPGPDRAPFWAAFSLTIAAARAHGLSVLDGVYGALDDAAGLTAECVQGRQFGFDGKTLIHPGQIEPCNSAFSPSAARVAWAQAVVAAFADPTNAGKGALRVDGGLAERLHLVQAERILAASKDVGG